MSEFNFQALDDMESDYFSGLLYGYQGTGKTSLAATLAVLGPMAFIDLTGEKGIRSLQGAPYAHNIKVFRPKSVTELDDLYWSLARGNHQFKSVVIDSLTAAQGLAMRFLQNYDETVVREIRRGTAPPSMQTWGQSLEIMKDLATYWCGLADSSRPQPMHVVLTAQVKTLENEVEGIVERLPDVQKGAVSATLASPDYVLWTQAEEDPEVEDGVLYTVRIGAINGYRTKARIPVPLRGKIPSVLGRSGKPVDLVTLGRILGVGGMQALPAAPVASATTDGAVASTVEGTA